MKLICSIATIIERGKARQYVTTHICSSWCCLQSRHKSQDMSQDKTPLQVQSSDELAEHELTLRKQIITKNSRNNNRILAAVNAHLQGATSDPQGKNSHSEFSSPKTCRNDARGSLIRIRAWSSRNVMTSQTCKRRKHALNFFVFPSVKFCESLYTS